MKRRFRRNASEADVDMTPMLDIVFIMLIFFIVTATFFDESGIKMTQPQDGGHTGAKSISVYLYADGSASLDGTRIDIGNVPNRVQSIRAEAPQAVVILGADRKATHGNVAFLKDRLDSAHIPVSLKVRME
ncbi:MAG: biopolymer transporter ExbD [Robiginitomaculum sp.]|nr:biopolymer transporter ExbD [Robiginitomaculum sp.]